MFFLLKVSDAEPNTATSVAPAATFEQERKNNLQRCFDLYFTSAGIIWRKNLK